MLSRCLSLIDIENELFEPIDPFRVEDSENVLKIPQQKIWICCAVFFNRFNPQLHPAPKYMQRRSTLMSSSHYALFGNLEKNESKEISEIYAERTRLAE